MEFTDVKGVKTALLKEMFQTLKECMDSSIDAVVKFEAGIITEHELGVELKSNFTITDNALSDSKYDLANDFMNELTPDN